MSTATITGNIVKSVPDTPVTTGPTLTERIAAPTEQWLQVSDMISRKIRVALPGIIQSFDSARQVVSVQPAIREYVQGQFITLPRLDDVPIALPRSGGSGGYGLTVPIQAGAECWLLFSDLCIDASWQSGGVQNPILPWRHQIGDAVAIIAAWSKPNAVPAYSGSAAQLRSNDGTSFIDFAKGQTTITDNAVIGNGFTGHIASNTGQITSFHDGIMMNLDSVGGLNLAYFESQLARIAASQDCNDLNLQSSQMLATLNKSIASITTLISQLAPLIVAPTDLPSVITWATNMIAPMLLAHTNCITQLSALNAKLSALQSAITARLAALGCS